MLLLDAPQPPVIPVGEPILDMPGDDTLPNQYRACFGPFAKEAFLDVSSPSRTGLDDLKASGSADFSVGQFHMLQQALPTQSLIVVDLRQESHGLVNNMCVSWFSIWDSVNAGKSVEQAEEDEARRLQQIADKGLVRLNRWAGKDNGDPAHWVTVRIPVQVRKTETEEELVTGSGARYYRIAAADLQPPDAEDVDRFIQLYRTLGPEDWLHFHCCAGNGRTTTFMTLYDMMRNYGKVSAADIIARQHFIGGIDLTDLNRKPGKVEWSQQRLDAVNRFYRYCQEQGPGYPLLYSEWLKQQPAA